MPEGRLAQGSMRQCVAASSPDVSPHAAKAVSIDTSSAFGSMYRQRQIHLIIHDLARHSLQEKYEIVQINSPCNFHSYSSYTRIFDGPINFFLTLPRVNSPQSRLEKIVAFNKKILALAAFATMFAAGSAMAADGTLNFTGKITAASCSITGGAGSTVTGGKGDQNIAVDLGTVSADALGGTAGNGIAAGTAINLNLDCGNTATDLTTVKVKFDPLAGSGTDAKNNKLLKTTGTATGVGIGIYNADNKLLNLAANETFDAPLVKTGEGAAAVYTASLNMRAGYVANGEKIDAGTANGTLPFTLTYE
ncbi:fimbrial protein [Burkholderia cepacia]|uniref:fimbrial protein n=1 Tax=Burkholderia cepacia TaxID=292 RepID=UPI001E57FF58|nr:fimbrial protein [Burkholderia cepacia]